MNKLFLIPLLFLTACKDQCYQVYTNYEGTHEWEVVAMEDNCFTTLKDCEEFVKYVTTRKGFECR